VAAAATLTVSGAALITTNALSFDGSAELDGYFALTGGAAGDTLIGGALVDTISGGAGADRITGSGGADSLTGGTGADTFVYTSASVAHSAGTGADTITDFTTTSDKIEVTLSYSTISAGVDVNTNFVSTSADLSAKRGEVVYDSTASKLYVNVNNDNFLTTQDFTINVGTVAAGDVLFNVTGSAFGDTLTGGTGADTLAGGAGDDSITGGAGADVISTTSGADTVIGGAAADSMTGGTGVDIFKWTATTAATFATEAGTNAGATAVFTAGSIGDKVASFTSTTDKLHFAAAGLTNAVGTENDTAIVIAAAGTVTNVARFVVVSTDQADLLFATAVTLLDGLTTAAVAIGDSFIAAIDNGTDTALYYVKQVSVSDTIAAQDVTLIGQITGTAQLANGDFVSF